jgi:hypothetical protein
MFLIQFTSRPDPVFSLAGWFGWTIMASGFAILAYTLKLMRSGEQRPIAVLKDNLRAQWRRYAVILLGMTLAGVDMYFFMILKPELNVLFPFWADPHLANLDSWMLGRDPWQLFSGWNLELLAWLYSPFWFFSILLTFYWLLLRPSSAAKSTAILAYFATWSIFGPISQALFSSGGPIFYKRLGFGDRFEAMPVPALARTISNYLWTAYHQRSLAPGAGISAMPSLHLASMAWMLMVFATFRSRWLVPAAFLTVIIYVGSVALGWHYATDGLIGAAGAGLCFYLSRLYCSFRNAAPQLGKCAPLGLEEPRSL